MNHNRTSNLYLTGFLTVATGLLLSGALQAADEKKAEKPQPAERRSEPAQHSRPATQTPRETRSTPPPASRTAPPAASTPAPAARSTPSTDNPRGRYDRGSQSGTAGRTGGGWNNGSSPASRSTTTAEPGRDRGRAGSGNPAAASPNAGSTPASPSTAAPDAGRDHGRSGSPSGTTGRAGGGWNNGSTQSGRTATTPEQNSGSSRAGRPENNGSGGRSGSSWGSGRSANERAGADRAGSARPGIQRAPDGRVQSYRSSSGREVRYGTGGRVQTVYAGGRTIVHGAGNSSRIIHERSDRSVIVTNRSGHGYVQRPFAYRGNEYVTRTYYRNGNAYARYYRPYSYHGVVLHAYAPVRYYSPVFYGWAYRPWGARVSYRWGWAGSPWYGYYGGYFAPSPYYASPSLWLVDYIISARLAEAYSERAAQAQSQGYMDSGSGLSPEIKDAIAAEVQRQLQMEGQESQTVARNDMPDPAAGGIAQAFSDGREHVFVVSYTIDVTDNNGQFCSVSKGDVLKLTTPPDPGAESAYVQVVASKGSGCRKGSLVAVSLQDLQDTQNQMRESIAQGLGELQTKSGQDGLPPLPAGAKASPISASFAEAAPPPYPEVAEELRKEVREADQVEQEVIAEASAADGTIPPSAGSTPIPSRGSSQAPVTISLGQTINQVMAVLGNPRQVVNLGKKQLYIYPEMKITFVDGKVTDVQ